MRAVTTTLCCLFLCIKGEACGRKEELLGNCRAAREFSRKHITAAAITLAAAEHDAVETGSRTTGQGSGWMAAYEND